MEKELKPKQEIWQKMINDKQDISIILGKKEKIIFSILDEVEFSSFDLHFMCFKVRWIGGYTYNRRRNRRINK